MESLILFFYIAQKIIQCLRFRHSIQQVNVNTDVNKEMNDQVTKILVSNQSYFGFELHVAFQIVKW